MAGHYTKYQRDKAGEAILYDFLIRKHPTEFIKAGNSLRYKGNRSISIKKGYKGYRDFANDETWTSVDFIVRYLGYSYVDAVLELAGEAGCDCDRRHIAEAEAPKAENNPPIFPKRENGPYKRLFAYLLNRGISRETIQKLIDEELIYQEEEYKNIVFLNLEKDWAEIRGTNTYSDIRCTKREKCPKCALGEHQWCLKMKTCEDYRKDPFHGIVLNSRENGFWYMRVDDTEKIMRVYVCESAIDAISLYELQRMDNMTQNAIYVSIAGAGKQKTIDRLKKHKGLILAVDNDTAGDKCRTRNPEIPFILPQNKDWNDDLIMRKNIETNGIKI